jgi:hypothetical protein
MAGVRTNVALSLFADFKNFTDFAPGDHQSPSLDTLLGEVIAWSEALAPLRKVEEASSDGWR